MNASNLLRIAMLDPRSKNSPTMSVRSGNSHPRIIPGSDPFSIEAESKDQIKTCSSSETGLVRKANIGGLAPGFLNFEFPPRDSFKSRVSYMHNRDVINNVERSDDGESWLAGGP